MTNNNTLAQGDYSIDKKILENAEALDILRFIGAMCVVLFHYNRFTGTDHNDKSFPFFYILGPIYERGGIWVEFFFLLSGFTFFLVYERRICNIEINILDFIKKRIVRLFPLYYISTICLLISYHLSSFLLGTGVAGYKHMNYSFIYILLNVFGIARGWKENHTYPYNNVAWTISVEIFCYLLFFIICRFISNPRIRKIICLLLSFIGMFVFYKKYDYPMINKEMARGVACFFFGGVLCYFQRVIEERKLKKITCIVSLIFLLICILLKIDKYWYGYAYLTFPMLLIFVVNSKYINKFFRIKIFKRCGEISFSIYLNQLFVMSSLYIICGLLNYSNFNSKLFWLLYFVILLIVSIFTNRVIEKSGKRLFEKILYRH